MLFSNQKSNNLTKIAKKHNAIYAVIEPNTFAISHNTPKEPFKSLVPIQTTVIDITQSLDDILQQMHQKTRYNIKVAKKHNIQIKESEDIELFYRMMHKTALRDKFAINSYKYIKTFYQTLKKQNKAQLLIAYKDQEAVSGLILTYFHNTAIYYYGASLHEHRKYMAPYLIQWQAIQNAKAKGCTTYDFLGVTTSKNPRHQLYGVSQFKLKFKGPVLNFTNREIIVYKPFIFQLLKLKKFISNLFSR